MKNGDKIMVFSNSGFLNGTVTDFDPIYGEFNVDGKCKFQYKHEGVSHDVKYTSTDIVGSLTKSYFGIPQN
jgi:hypothetical protein